MVNPFSGNSSGSQPNSCANNRLRRASAIGLRQVLPVQTNTIISFARRLIRVVPTTPGSSTSNPVGPIATTAGGGGKTGGPPSETLLTAPRTGAPGPVVGP